MRAIGAALGAGLAGLAVLGSGALAPVWAQEVSVTCAVELVRRDAIAASDYTKPIPDTAYWVAKDGASVGPWSAIEIKRRMLKGELPVATHVWDPDAQAWVTTQAFKGLEPLPGDPRVSQQEIANALPALLTGCWVSDPVAEAAGQLTTWIFLLFENREVIQSRGVIEPATGAEGFWFSRTSTEDWAIKSQSGTDFVITLPDISWFDPVDDFAGRVIDRNTIVLFLPGTNGLTLRRM